MSLSRRGVPQPDAPTARAAPCHGWAGRRAALALGAALAIGTAATASAAEGAGTEAATPGGEAASGYPWLRPPPPQPNWSGAAADVGYFLSYQIVGVAVLYVMPKSVSGWGEQEKENYSFDKWRENTSQPVKDSDAFVVNYVLHPYWGAAYYVRARERGLSRWQSFGFSALMSTLWEYGAEALAEPVSIQDLIVTPVVGSLLGEYVFEPWRAAIRAGAPELDPTDQAILALTDPLGAINAKVNQWFGIKASTQLMPLRLRSGAPAAAAVLPGLAPTAPQRGPYWGLQLRLTW